MEKKENNKKSLKSRGKTLLELLMCVAGTVLYSAGVSLFVKPMNFAAGGVTGLGIIVNYLVPQISVGMFVFLINIPLFIVSWRVFGYKFIARTMFTTASLSIFLDIFAMLGDKFGWYYSGDEKLLAAIFGGILAGTGLGIVFMNGSTTGGLDILARLLRLKFPHLSVGKLILICDFTVVILTGIVFRSVESILYSTLIVFLSSQAVDYVIAGKSHSKMLLINTSAPDEVCRDINKLTGRGVSFIYTQGGYTGTERKMIMCVVRIHEVAIIRKIVAKYDDKPFIIITDASEVLGQGFKSHNDTL